jgi:hypothetical protein
MNWALAALVSVLFVEVFIRLPLNATIASLLSTMRKSLRVLQSARISDHWKERALRAYSGHSLIGSLKLAALLFIALIPAVVAVVAADYFGAGLQGFLLSPLGILWSTVVAIIYVHLRSRLAGARL